VIIPGIVGEVKTVIAIVPPEGVHDQKMVEEVGMDQWHGFEIGGEQIVATTRLQACLHPFGFLDV